MMFLQYIMHHACMPLWHGIASTSCTQVRYYDVITVHVLYNDLAGHMNKLRYITWCVNSSYNKKCFLLIIVTNFKFGRKILKKRAVT